MNSIQNNPSTDKTEQEVEEVNYENIQTPTKNNKPFSSRSRG